jgi:hypothetical protein
MSGPVPVIPLGLICRAVESVHKSSDSNSSIFKTSDSDSSIFKTSDSDSSIFKTPITTPSPS